MSDRITYRDMQLMERVLHQEEIQVCWAISMTRQLTALLKLQGVLGMNASLSIQYLINKVGSSIFGEQHPREWDGSINNLQIPIPFLVNGGSVLEHVVPLQFDLQSTTSEARLIRENRYRAVRIIVHRREDYVDEAAFEDDLMRCLRISPVAAAVKLFPSFSQISGNDIYSPTAEEMYRFTQHHFLAAIQELGKYRHCMLLVKSDRSPLGVPYWQFQDSCGEWRGEGGYINISKGQSMLTHFVEMVLVENETGKKRKREGADVDVGSHGEEASPSVKKMRGTPSESSTWQKRQALGSRGVGFRSHVLSLSTGEAEDEVKRLNALKSSKLKELVLKRQCELEEICREVHMDANIHAARQSLLNPIDSGDLSDFLESLDAQIQKAKEEALSRKEILDKVDKLKHAKEDEKCRMETGFSAVRGAHNGHTSRTGGLSVSLSAPDGSECHLAV